MTITALINKVKEEKPNAFSDAKLLGFINEIEQDVSEELREEDEFYPYATVTNTELKAPAPYDRLYVSYLKAQIDYANEELLSYANNQAQHVQDYRDFVDWVVREKKAEISTMPARFRNVF